MSCGCAVRWIPIKPRLTRACETQARGRGNCSLTGLQATRQARSAEACCSRAPGVTAGFFSFFTVPFSCLGCRGVPCTGGAAALAGSTFSSSDSESRASTAWHARWWEGERQNALKAADMLQVPRCGSALTSKAGRRRVHSVGPTYDGPSSVCSRLHTLSTTRLAVEERAAGASTLTARDACWQAGSRRLPGFAKLCQAVHALPLRPPAIHSTVSSMPGCHLSSCQQLAEPSQQGTCPPALRPEPPQGAHLSHLLPWPSCTCSLSLSRG